MPELNLQPVSSAETPVETKLRLEIRKLKLDIGVASLGIAFAISFSVGAVLLYFYFFRQRFSPGGISASDAVPIILVGFSFGAANLVCLIYGTLTAFPVSRAGHWLLVRLREKLNARRLGRRGATPAGEVALLIGSPTSQRWRDGMMFFCWIGVAFLCGGVLIFINAENAARFFMVAIFVVGLWLSLFVFGTQIPVYSAWPKQPRSSSRVDLWMQRQTFSVRRMSIVFTTTFIMLALVADWTQDGSMLAIGYRKHNVSVRLSKEDFQTVIELATRAGYALNACRPLDSSSPVIDHMDVLWHKLGTAALIRYPALPLGVPTAAERAAIRFEPLNASIMVIQGVTERDNCSEYLTDTIFRLGEAELTSRADFLLDEQFKRWGSDPSQWKFRIAVIDTVEPVRAAAQAVALKAHLIRRYRLASSAIVIDGRKTERKRACGSTESGTLCETANRRIEIRTDVAHQ